MSNCGTIDKTGGPTVVVNGPTGSTPPCPENGSTQVCVPQRCCNFFNLPADGGGDSFIFSAGGPFEVGLCGQTPSGGSPCETSCPSACSPSVLTLPTGTVPGVIPPGVLSSTAGGGAEAGIVCLGTCFSGSFQLTARAELIDAPPGERVQVIFFPDCSDVSQRFIVLDCGVDCSFVCPGGGAPPTTVGKQPVCKICTGDLSVFLQGSNPGFQLLVTQACNPPGTDATHFPRPAIQNFQFKAVRLTNRNSVDCSGSDLLSTGQYLNQCTVLDCGAVVEQQVS